MDADFLGLLVEFVAPALAGALLGYGTGRLVRWRRKRKGSR
ncbi:MAG: hypothetical protein ACXWVD_00380 [Telluria sp.]